MNSSTTAVSLLLLIVVAASSSLLGGADAIPLPALRGGQVNDTSSFHRFLPANDGECAIVAIASSRLIHDYHDHGRGLQKDTGGPWLKVSDEEEFVCEFDDNTVVEIDGDIEQQRELRKKLNQGQIISGKNRVRIDQTTYDPKTKKLKFKKNVSVKSIVTKLTEEEMLGAGGSGNNGNGNGNGKGNDKRNNGNGNGRNDRRLADYTADKYLLIVRANFLDLPYPYSAEEISGMCHGDCWPCDVYRLILHFAHLYQVVRWKCSGNAYE